MVSPSSSQRNFLYFKTACLEVSISQLLHGAHKSSWNLDEKFDFCLAAALTRYDFCSESCQSCFLSLSFLCRRFTLLFFFLFAWLIQSPGLSYILYDIMYLFNQHVSSSSACCAHLHKSVLMCWTVGFSSAAGSREGSIFICKNSCWHQTNDPTAAKISQSLLYKTNFI